MQKGSIRVQTENIFPIIKKFLYSDHEIFLRELVSNAVDATQKLKALASLGEFSGELGSLDIEVKIDTEKKTLSVTDHGIGMSGDEVDRYINQVAFSGAEEFLDKYKGQPGEAANIIGHFGLGFYSSFMVSDRVEILSRSYREGTDPVRWECDGSPEYQLETTERIQRGTEVVLHISEDNQEFLEPERIRHILEKFCRFLPVPIYFEGKQINNTQPAWTRKPSELTSQDYQNFYKELYPFSEPALFWIHLNVDYPFHLTGILYFPRIKNSFEVPKDRIRLYSNQVFVTDEVRDIVPEFLMLLQGVIDSPDIPLNVSRSYLQGDPNVRKINSHITKKVADKLEEIFRNDRKEFEEKWEFLGLFVKYGMMTDDKFLEKASRYLLFRDSDLSRYYTLEEYRAQASAAQTNKNKKLVILYANDPVIQDSYIQAARAKGYRVIELNTLIDSPFIHQMEMKWEDIQFTRVDADIPDNLIDAEEKKDLVLSKDEESKLKDLFGLEVPDQHIKVTLKGLSPEAAPVIVTRPEFTRRMKEMASASGNGMDWYSKLPDEISMTVNANHPIFGQILAEQDKQKQRNLVRNLADLALLSQQLLNGADLTAFVNRSIDLLYPAKKSRIILEP